MYYILAYYFIAKFIWKHILIETYFNRKDKRIY